MNKVSVVILTHNEEGNILDCLESVMFADEIIVIDDYSDDRTEEIIKNLKKSNIKFFKRKLDNDFSKQREFGLLKVKNDWVLFVDADERVSTSLRENIQFQISNIQFQNINAYYVKRRDIMWGSELKHGETGNMKLVRFAKKSVGKWKGRVHEVWDVKGVTFELKSVLIHYPHPTVREFLKEINTYSTIRAEELHRSGGKVSFISIIIYPKAKFIVNYLLKLGFLDGLPGFVMALMMSFHSFLVRSKLWQLNQK